MHNDLEITAHQMHMLQLFVINQKQDINTISLLEQNLIDFKINMLIQEISNCNIIFRLL